MYLGVFVCGNIKEQYKNRENREVENHKIKSQIERKIHYCRIAFE